MSFHDCCYTSKVEVKIEVQQLNSSTWGEFYFDLLFLNSYPFKPPTVYLKKSALNIDNTLRFADLIDVKSGKVLLPIFSKEWSPVLDVSMVIYILEILVTNPESVLTTSAIEIHSAWQRNLKLSREAQPITKLHPDCNIFMKEPVSMPSKSNNFLTLYPNLMPCKRKRK